MKAERAYMGCSCHARVGERQQLRRVVVHHGVTSGRAR